MIKKILLAIVAIAIIAVLFFIPHELGQVAITYANWHFETNIWMFILGLIATFILFKMILGIIKFVFDIPGFIGKYQKNRQLRKYETNLESGILSLVTQNWDQAYKYLKSTNKAESHIIDLLASAIAASKTDNLSTALELLRKANEEFSSQAEAIIIIKSQVLLDHNKYSDALTELNSLLNNKGESKARLLQLIKSYEKTYSWRSLLELSSKIKSYKVYNKNDLEKLEILWATNLINMHSDYETDYESLLEIFNSLPNHLKYKSEILLGFLKQSKDNIQDVNVDYAIEQALKQDWSEELLLAYRNSKSQDYNKRLKNLEKLLNFHSNDAQMLLTLGLFSLKAQLWGKAKEYLLKSLMLDDKCGEARLQLEILQNNLGEIEVPKAQIEAYLLACPNLVNDKIN